MPPRLRSLLFLATVFVVGAAGAAPVQVFKCVGFYTQPPPYAMEASTLYLHNDGLFVKHVRVRWYYLDGTSILDPVVALAAEETRAESAPSGKDPEAHVVAAKVTTSHNDVLVDARAVHVFSWPNFTERQVLCKESNTKPDSLQISGVDGR